jgi:uncharacterized protein (TIGR03435 family)
MRFFVPGLLAATSLLGQSKFEVASIKLCPPGTPGFNSANGGGTPGRVRIVCQSVRALILNAYVFYANGRRNPITSRIVPIEKVPAWAASDLYTIEAKAPGTPSADIMLGPMMQALLEERLKLKLHTRYEELPVYNLTVANGGHTLQPSTAGNCWSLSSYEPLAPSPGKGPPALCGLPQTMGGEWRMSGATMADIAAALSLGSDRLVIDKTGIAGTFDARVPLTAEFAEVLAPRAPGAPLPSPAEILDVHEALAQKLGLKLTAAKGQAPILVIDHIEKPGEN